MLCTFGGMCEEYVNNAALPVWRIVACLRCLRLRISFFSAREIRIAPARPSKPSKAATPSCPKGGKGREGGEKKEEEEGMSTILKT